METNHINNRPLTTELTREIAPDLLVSEIDDRITRIRPSSTPIDQISRMIGARRAGSMKVEYYSVDTKPGQSTVNEPLRGVTVSAGESLDINVKDPALFAVSETVLLPTLKLTAGSGIGQSLVGYITEINGNNIRILPTNADPGVDFSECGNLEKGDPVVRMGRAARELDVQTAQYVALPKKDYNFCQIFKSQVEESFFQRLADKEVGWTFSDQEEVAIIDMRLGMEKSFLFGARARLYPGSSSDDELLLTGGIWNQTTHEFRYRKGEISNNNFATLGRAAFTGQSGSSRKILIGGSGLIEELSGSALSRIVSAADRKTVWGIDFDLIATKFGTLYVHHSEVFDLCGMDYCGMVIDPEYLTKYSHVPFSAERISFRKQGLRNTEGVVLTEASCIVLRHPDTHMRIMLEE